MKPLQLFLLLLLSFHCANATSIGVGYFSNDVIIWRFWEIGSDHIPMPRMLVYNISDKPVSFFLNKANSRGGMDSMSRKYLLKMAGTSNDTVVKPAMIPAHECKVYDIISIKSGLYDEAFVNGKRIGIMSDLEKPKIEKFTYRYYSYEGLNGGYVCLIGKNKLFKVRGETDSMLLYFDCTYKPYNEKSRDISAEASRGIEQLSLCMGNDCHVPDVKTNKIGFPVNIENNNLFTLNITYTVAQNDQAIFIDLHESIPQYGSSRGARLPVLIK